MTESSKREYIEFHVFLNNPHCDEIIIYRCDCNVCEEKYSDTHKFFEALVYNRQEGVIQLLDELGDVTIKVTDSNTFPQFEYYHIEKELLLKFLDKYSYDYKDYIEEIRNLH